MEIVTFKYMFKKKTEYLYWIANHMNPTRLLENASSFESLEDAKEFLHFLKGDDWEIVVVESTIKIYKAT